MIETLMAFPTATLIAFLIGALVLNLTPGSDVMFAIASGLQGGPRAGLAAGLGIGIGGIFHTLATAFGLAAVVAAHPGVLDVVRWAGAAYLLWIAVKSWRAAPPVAGRDGGGAGGRAGGAMRPRDAFRRGVVTNVLNPKVALFMLAYLPQFTDPAIGPLWQQMLILGSIVFLGGMIITMGYGATAGWLGMRLVRRMGALNKVAACLFGGLAAKLALSEA